MFTARRKVIQGSTVFYVYFLVVAALAYFQSHMLWFIWFFLGTGLRNCVFYQKDVFEIS